jgi:hypothetical protein
MGHLANNRLCRNPADVGFARLSGLAGTLENPASSVSRVLTKAHPAGTPLLPKVWRQPEMEPLPVPVHRMWDGARPGAASGFRAYAAEPAGRSRPPYTPGSHRGAPCGPMGSGSGSRYELRRCRYRLRRRRNWIDTNGRGDCSLVGAAGRACRTCRTASPPPAL